MATGETSAENAERSLYQDHNRLFAGHRFVYPVVSRRSHGVSIGVNLNPDKVCNFDCIYCQVDRRSEAETRFVETQQLYQELREVLLAAISGELFQVEKFRRTPMHLRRVNDIAFSGDGEPTTFRNFDDIVEQCVKIRNEVASDDIRMVLITNASMFHREHVRRGLKCLRSNNGQIWAKLDAGTEEYYRLVDRTRIPFQQILDNIRDAAITGPVVIQSLFMNVNGEPPVKQEIDAYCERLAEIVRAGGQIDLVQIYTVVRQPAESFVTPLHQSELDSIAESVLQRTGLSTAVFT